MRIIYVGPLWYGTTCLQRMEAIRDLGHEVIPVDTGTEDIRKKEKQLINRIIRKILGPIDFASINKKLLQVVEKEAADVIWLDRILTLKNKTLIELKKINPGSIIAGYSPDDLLVRRNRSYNFLKVLPLYDIYFTTKSYNVSELKELGCKEAVFVGNSYDTNIHRPWDKSVEDCVDLGATVGFIGDYERARAETMLYLAKNDIPVRIWGTNWEKCKVIHPNLRIERRSIWGEDYARAICSIDINLGFLRKISRDLQTTRSIEIPACGGFMLAERTQEHLELFEEGKEAEFFSTNEELLNKIKYYLDHEDERKRIAWSGRERCIKNKYSNHDRMQQMLDIVRDLNETS